VYFLSRDPGKVSTQGRVGQQVSRVGKLAVQAHFVVALVNAVVTLPTEIDAAVEFFPRIAFFEAGAPV
jgi:hypothetical protein